MLLVALW